MQRSACQAHKLQQRLKHSAGRCTLRLLSTWASALQGFSKQQFNHSMAQIMSLYTPQVHERLLTRLVSNERVVRDDRAVAGRVARADHCEAAARVAGGVAAEVVPRHLQVVGRLQRDTADSPTLLPQPSFRSM